MQTCAIVPDLELMDGKKELKTNNSIYLVTGSMDTMCNVWKFNLPVDEITDVDFHCLNDEQVLKVGSFTEHTKAVTCIRGFYQGKEALCASADKSGLVYVRVLQGSSSYPLLYAVPFLLISFLGFVPRLPYAASSPLL